MPVEMQGQRIDIGDDDPYVCLTKPGDYCGPTIAKGETVPSVWFLLPIARDPGVHGPARALHHVCSPPHVFTEEPDGSLTIRESIGAGPNGNYYWHGYLTKGRWQLNP